jgi:hypothetical protein
MKRSEAFPSKYISKDDVNPPILANIMDVRSEVFEEEEGKKSKPVMYFGGEIKPLILNNTNWMTLESEWGDDSDSWKGKTVELYCDPNVMFGKKMVGGVRIRVGTSRPPFANYAAAEKYAEDNGVEAQILKEHLRDKGLTKFNPVKDSQIVYQFVDEMLAERNAEEF